MTPEEIEKARIDKIKSQIIWDDTHTFPLYIPGFPTKADIDKLIQPPDIIMRLIEELSGIGDTQSKFQLPKLIGKGNRNTTIHKLASAYRSKGLEWDEILHACLAVNTHRSDGERLSDDEVKTIVQSACRYEKGEAAPPLEDTTLEEFVICLGHQGNDYFFTSSSNRQISKIAKGGFSLGGLLDLMPYEYWEQNFRTTSAKGGQFNLNKATSFLMQKSREKGIFSVRRCRGRGVWNDRKRVVHHTGSTIVDLQSKHSWSLGRFETSYIYQLCESTVPAPAKVSPNGFKPSDLIQLCQMFNWKAEQDAYLLCGWLALSRFGGALKWRPHIWISGQKGTGKTTIINDFVRLFVGRDAPFFMGETTAAGVRQFIGCDALPIIFDEAETSNERSSRRTQGIIELCRQASSENEAYIVKGTPDGKGMYYKMNSMFCLGSIRVNLAEEQDRSRFCVLELDPPKQEHWAEIQKVLAGISHEHGEIIFEAFSRKMPLLRRVIDIFVEGLAETFSKRTADQYGALLGGYFAVTFDREPTKEEVGKLASKLSLDDIAGSEDETDSQECVSAINQVVIRVTEPTGPIDCTIHEAILKTTSSIHAEHALGLYGIAVDSSGWIYIANKNLQLAKALAATPWADGRWAKSLSRLPGSEKARRRIQSTNTLHCIKLKRGAF